MVHIDFKEIEKELAMNAFSKRDAQVEKVKKEIEMINRATDAYLDGVSAALLTVRMAMEDEE